MPSLTIENYVKAIYQIGAAQEGRAAATGQIAAALNVSPGTVTSMLKTLQDSGLVAYTPYEGVQLSEQGRLLALRVLRRHRLIELFLTTTLDLSWDEVHDEAENLEHAVSDRLIDRIDAYLGHPEVDPHGDPIPTADGTMRAAPRHALTDWAIGAPFRLVRVLDQDPEFLRYLSETGLKLGARGKVTANRREAGIVQIEIAGVETALGREAAEKILVEAVEEIEN